MALQLTTLGIFVISVVIGAVRGIHLGILTLAVACTVGMWLAGMSIDDVIAGFPMDLLVLLAGVTFFFGVAHANGTVDRILDAALRRVGERTAMLPLAFFGVTAAISSMGNPGGGLVMVPIGMSVAKKKNIDPALMAVALATGISAGGFSPTSLLGILTYGTARQAGIDVNPMLLFAIALTVDLILLAAAYVLFGRSVVRDRPLVKVLAGRGAGRDDGVFGISSTGGSGDVDDLRSDDSGSNTGERAKTTGIQKITITSIVVLFAAVITATALGASPDIGVLTLSLGVLLALIDPKSGSAGIKKIDWNTILLVGGIVTYVGVLEHVGAIEFLGHFAASMSVPLVAAFMICVIAGLASAFASTLGMLTVVIPLAVPLAIAGGIPGWAMICAVGLCSSVVDVSPLSTAGATIVASTPDETERPRLTRILMRWGLSMAIIGPVVMVGGLIVPSMLL